MTMSAQLVQICALFSQSHRSPSTYFPGGVSAGIASVSTTLVAYGKRPEQTPVSLTLRSTVSVHGGGNCGACL